MVLFRKKDSRFYWYDFKLRGKQYRRSTKETNKKRAGKIAALRFSQAMGGTDLLDRKAPDPQEFSTRFLSWVESATLAAKSKAYYCEPLGDVLDKLTISQPRENTGFFNETCQLLLTTLASPTGFEPVLPP